MANYAYLSLWFRDFTIERGAHHLEALLTLFPVSKARADYRLIIRSLDPSQGISLEREPLSDPAEVRELASQFLHDDTSFEVTAFWDLWQWRQPEGLKIEWEQKPSQVELLLQGEQFDEGRFRETGHVWLRLGPEHLFTGHAGALTGAELKPEDFTTRAENEFAWALQEPQTLHDYRSYTRKNIRIVCGFLREIETSLPLERYRLWSEGEAGFDKLTGEILAGSS